MNSSLLRLLLQTLGVLVLQVVFLTHLTILRAPADFVFVFCLWVATQTDRTGTLLIVAVAAFLQDALTDTWGLHLISKTLFFYLFYPLIGRLRDSSLTVPQVFSVVFGAALVYHLLMLGVAGFSSVLDAGSFFWQLLLAGSLYTALTATIAYLLRGQ